MKYLSIAIILGVVVEPLFFSQIAVVAVFAMLLYVFTNKFLGCYEN
jgi:hypothetical protein